ncbi:MAG TPA: SAM-dependent methyltransferase [Allosphingosinicella sp.]|jgi:tRNA (Thr-GGU) A37 N-methylase
MTAYRIEAVGRVRGGRGEAEDDDWGSSRARIELDPGRFTAEAFAGLAEFSHVEVVFLFDRIGPEEVEFGARHPRGRADWPRVGIFAQRGRNRPNRIGVSVCRIVAVDGTGLEVEGLDTIDGTPVLDIKPVMRGFLPRGEVREPDWARQIMENYW